MSTMNSSESKNTEADSADSKNHSVQFRIGEASDAESTPITPAVDAPALALEKKRFPIPAFLAHWLSPDLNEELNENVSKTIKQGIWIILIFFIGLGAWATFVPIAGAVMAVGVLRVENNRQVVQHPAGGVIKAINVHNGDVVKAGDVLLELGDSRTSATYGLVLSMRNGEMIRQARLRAEQSGDAQMQMPKELLAQQDDPDLQKQWHNEKQLFEVHRQTLSSQQQILREQEDQSANQVLSFEDQIKSINEAIRLLREETDANTDMVAKGYVSKARMLQMQRSIAEYDAHMRELQGRVAATRQQTGELALRRSGLNSQFMQNAANELKESSAKLIDLAAQLRPTEENAQHLQIVAPVGGQIVNFHFNTLGSVIRPTEIILEIVPTNSHLVVDTQIMVNDINHVHIGTPAQIRLSAFNHRTTPEVTGKVIYVSADRLEEPGNHLPYYQVTISLDAESLAQAGNPELLPGMQTSLFIKSGEHTLLSYLLQPITDSISGAMHEP